MLKYINMKNLILILFTILAVGCASQAGEWVPYNEKAFSSAKEPKILILTPEVNLRYSNAEMPLVRLVTGTLSHDPSDETQLSESDRANKIKTSFKSIIHQFMDFHNIIYTVYDEKDAALPSLDKSQLLNIKEVGYPDKAWDRYKDLLERLNNGYLRPDTLTTLAHYNVDYILATVVNVEYGHHVVNGWKMTGTARMVLFNAKTGMIAWHSLKNDAKFQSSTETDIDSLGNTAKFRFDLYPLNALAVQTRLISSINLRDNGKNINLECLWDKQKKSLGLSKLRKPQPFYLSINFDERKGSYQDLMPLKVSTIASDIHLTSVFDDKFIIQSIGTDGRWSGIGPQHWLHTGPKFEGEKTFTCSDTSAIAKLAASPRPSPPEGDSAKKDIKDTLAPLKKECESLGYKEETEQFGACVLKLLDNS